MSFARLPLLALVLAAAPASARDVAALRDAALKDDLAWEITEGLTTEIGARMAGTPAEARARDWAVKKLKGLGFSNVHVQPFTLPTWVRGEERAELIAPFPQTLVVTALGGSGATPPQGIEAEVVAFESHQALQAAPAAQVRGKIVFVDHGMARTQDGSSYGQFGVVRRQGSTVAAEKGALAIVIRSIGTDKSRGPHAGQQGPAPGVNTLPAGALSTADADQLLRVLKRGKPVRMKLTLTPRQLGEQPSGNVIAEVPGRDPKLPVILVACHLDSWDLGTGAIDDASGCGIVTAAAKRIMEDGRPERTIRVVWFGAEEVGLVGGRAYLARNGIKDLGLVAESDFGADRIWRLDSKVSPATQGRIDAMMTALRPIGVNKGFTDQAGGSDITPLVDAGAPVVELQQDGTRYFDLHHTPEDTLDKVDPAQLRQNVAAWTVMLAVAADTKEAF